MTKEMKTYERFREIYFPRDAHAPTPERIEQKRAPQGRERAVRTLKDMAFYVLLILALLAWIIFLGMLETA